MAEDGQEVLIVDSDEKVQRGLHQLLAAEGLTPTVLSDVARAERLLREKFFAAALFDLDTPAQNGGLELLRRCKPDAPNTAMFVMASRKVFEVAVEAFRIGAADVVLKAPDQVAYLKRRVVELCSAVRNRVRDERLMPEVIGLQDEFLKRLMESSRRVVELEERIGGGAHSADADPACEMLLVEPQDQAWLATELPERLMQKGGYTLRTAGSGGEALDAATGTSFHIALVCDSLPDLPGSMVLTTLKSQSPDTITILYSRPHNGPGKAEVIEGSRAIALLPRFSNAQQMIERIDELKRAFVERSRERRYLAVFRQQHYELLRRFAEVKQKLQQAAKAG
jgi:DNA-binding NtrC family response regulator